MSQVNNTMYRIIYGKYDIKFDDGDYVVYQPSLDLQYRSNIFYNNIINKNRFNKWISYQQGVDVLVSSGLLSKNYEIELKNLYKSVENNKVELYLSYTNSKKQRLIRENLKTVSGKINDIENTLSYIIIFTLQGYARSQQFEFLLVNTIYKDENLVYSDEASVIDYNLLSTALSNFYLFPKDFRSIARSDNWSMYWKSTLSPFPDFKYLTDEQQQLLYYSKMYDSVQKHPECPPGDVINDDDMLDGWMIKQRRDSEEERKENSNQNMVNIPGATEVFIPASSKKDIEKITNMNTLQSKMVQKQREALIQKKGKVNDQDLLDNVLDKRQQIHKTIMDHKNG